MVCLAATGSFVFGFLFVFMEWLEKGFWWKTSNLCHNDTGFGEKKAENW